MQRLVAIVSLACFLFAALAAGTGDADAGIVPADGQSAPAVAAADETTDTADSDDCPCKETSGHTAFLCGVTLALSGEAGLAHRPAEAAARFVLVETGTRPGYIDLLKRPPKPHS